MLEHWRSREHRFDSVPVFYDEYDVQWDSVEQSVGWGDGKKKRKKKSDPKVMWSALGAVPEGQEYWPEWQHPECIDGECACCCDDY